MCDFFSFVENNGQFYFINSEQRKNRVIEYPDSHTQICKFYNLREESCNKYEYSKGEIIKDSIVSEQYDVEGFVEKYILPNFEELCIAAVEQDGSNIEFLTDNQRTEKVCIAAVKQEGLYIECLTDDQRTEKVCIAAVEQEEFAIMYLTKAQRKFINK